MRLKNVLAILPLLTCCACDPVTLICGGAAVLGATSMRNDGGVVGSISDNDLQVSINTRLLNEDDELFNRVELCIKHGMVIVIGYMDNESQCQRVMQIVKDVSGWRHVFDETKVASKPTAEEWVTDSALTSRIESSLLLDGNVQALNYNITTVKGVVYICGTAQTHFERDIVINYARSTSGVNKVIAYIKLKGSDNFQVKK